MSRADDLDLRYLEALLSLNGSMSHGLRSRMGAVQLQVDLITEILKLRQPGDLEAWEKIGQVAARAKNACEELTRAIDHVLSSTRSTRGSTTSLDLRAVLDHVAGVLAFHLRDKGALIRVDLPNQPVTLDGSRDVLQRALLVMLAEASQTVTAQQTLELRLDADGVLEVRGAPVHQWLPKVADIVEMIGAGLDASPEGSAVAIRLPIQTRT
jgi:hypothetical protein